MKGFRHVVVAVVAAYAATYGVLVFIEYRLIGAHQLPGNHPKFPPEAAWGFAALHATMIFGAIAVIGVLLAVLSFICEYFVLDDAELHRRLMITSHHPRNQSMKPTAPWRCDFSVIVTTPCHSLSLSR